LLPALVRALLMRQRTHRITRRLNSQRRFTLTLRGIGIGE
jgi:hypothetical protein